MEIDEAKKLFPDFHYLSKLGHGTYGTAFLISRGGKRQVAKIMGLYSPFIQYTEFLRGYNPFFAGNLNITNLREIIYLKNLHASFIPKIHEVKISDLKLDGVHIAIVEDYCGDNLMTYFRGLQPLVNDNTRLKTTISITHQLLQILVWLKDHNLVFATDEPDQRYDEYLRIR